MRSKKLKLIVGALLVTMVGATFVGCEIKPNSSDNNTALTKMQQQFQFQGQLQ